ncbi:MULTISPECIES: LysR family transcriptional regulator [unclassified Novosphingobium]|uniref:LysR family transcriptional regulator n=1 Tax=unclassified Novosphingobium TaxID=2644732 RepID=UPI00146EF772|nr:MULTISPECIES: LysR family transcriptional regulator [unclassified Novosphingobium]NMN06544.1 DNA-binding transcriptional LysR family regulator [Novosphingobium sp. SG919]NMN89007.1 DNA-binding transcriptional LysR family regulator [Novosphingobium sp. SG916]
MRFKGLDLNLLAAFDVLLENRSVSAAARQMNLSQPAMSAALTRLREFFADDLLVAQGKRMYPTAFAEALVPQVRETLRTVEAMLVTASRFDPTTTQRTFRLVASDYVVTAVLAPVLQALPRLAPGMRIELVLPSDAAHADLREGRADLLIAPEQFIVSDHPSELLCEERHVVMGWAHNPAFAGQGPDRDAFLAAGHVSVRIGASRDHAFADRQLNQIGMARRIEIEAPSFSTIPWMLMDTQRMAVVQERLARRMVAAFPLAMAPLPFPFQPMREMIQYHRTRTSDEGLRWLMARLREAAFRS